MPVNVEQVRKDALALPLVERAALTDELLSSLDRPDPRVDALWAQEAEDRLAAFEAGEMEAIPAEDVFAEFESP
jgi:putative addiction module component (TIGR02574 family)